MLLCPPSSPQLRTQMITATLKRPGLHTHLSATHQEGHDMIMVNTLTKNIPELLTPKCLACTPIKFQRLHVPWQLATYWRRQPLSIWK